MVENRKLFYAISLMLLTCCQIITMFPHNAAQSSESISKNSENNNAAALDSNSNQNMNNNNDDSDFLIVAAERKQQQQQHTINSNMGVWETQDNDSTPVDNIDDLIFLDKRPINHHQYEKQQQQRKEQLHQHHQQQQQQNQQHNMEFHHITMDGGSSSNEDTDSLTHTTYSSMFVVLDENDDDDDDNDDGAAAAAVGTPHEIELQPADINEEVTTLNVTPLDLSDFLSLIPATKVKTIVNHYYHNDPEVQRAHAFMSSRDFFMLKQHLIAVPEMSAFLRYLNNSGLDLVKFVTALTNLTSYEVDDAKTQIKIINESADMSATMMSTTEQIGNILKINDIEYAQKQSNIIIPTISNIEIQTQTTTTTAITPQLPATFQTTKVTMPTIDVVETTTAKEQLNGLHGLVDSILDVLPQDQILATFFDKLEANEQFAKLVDNIGSPEFAKILNNMQNSIPLRNLIFTLHNNGIYVIRIVDSLKSYFFLGGF